MPIQVHVIFCVSDFLELMAKLEIGKALSSAMTGMDQGHGHGHAHKRKRRAVDPATLLDQPTWVYFNPLLHNKTSVIFKLKAS